MSPILDRPLTADAVYDLFVNQSGPLYEAVTNWYREAKGQEPAHSDIQHGVYRSFEPKDFASRWGTMRRALQDTWPLALPPVPPSVIRPLHIEGTTFRDDTGALWQWRGYSWFLGYRRFLAGEDVASDLRWLKSQGFNLVRVFGPLPWDETPDYRYETFNVERLGDFFDLLASEGFYCEFVIGCYRFGDVTVQRRFAQRIYDVAQSHANVLIEAVNEPSVGAKPDPIAMLAGVDRRGVLSAYGLYASYYANPSVTPRALDYVTIHTTRDSAWHRKARHAQELQSATGRPTISDEPAKLTEQGFSYPGGKNDPIATPREAAWHFGICALWTPGGTVHTEEGKWGRVPTPNMLQHAVIERIKRDVWDKVDASWQTGRYTGSHLSSSPVDHIPEVWTYSSLHEDRALSVRCAVSQPQARAGWNAVDYWGEGSSFVRLER